MRFSLLLHSLEADEADVSPEMMEQFQVAFAEYAAALTTAGVLVSAEILQPVDATSTVTNHDGDLVVTHAPITASGEKLNGIFIVEVDERDTAIEWAARCPGAQYGTIEVRPVALSVSNGQWTQA